MDPEKQGSRSEGAVGVISIRKVTFTLAALVALFAILGLATQWWTIGPGASAQLISDDWAHLFDLDAEANLPSWFHTAMLLASAWLLWIVGSSTEFDARAARYWKILAGVFLYLSADENAAIHETLGAQISKSFGWQSVLGVYAWLIPALALVAVLGITSWRFLRQLPLRIRRTMVIAAVVYVGGAAGMEIVEAFLDNWMGTFSFSLLTVVEETLEGAGLVIFIHALLSYLKSRPGSTTLEIEP